MSKPKASFPNSTRDSLLAPMSVKYKTPTNLDSSRVRFKVGVRLHDTGEMFTVPNCHKNMKIRELKRALEIVAGIPSDFQRLCYLDQGDLMDETTIQHNDIVPGTCITVAIWPYDGWPELVRAAAAGDVYLLKTVVCKPAPPGYTGSSVGINVPGSWLSHRLFSALYICAHRGHMHALRFLIQNGANVKGQTLQGRGLLHAAAAQGRIACLQELLARGAPVGLQDGEGRTALDVASRLGQRQSARQLYLFRWQERAAGVRVKRHLDESELFAHQRFDSQLRTWHCGTHAQRYMAELKHRGDLRPRSSPLGGAPPQNTALRAARRAWMPNP